MEIDVLVPTFNGEKYVCEQIDSLLNQTNPNINIIIKDDCSTDATYELICERYKMQSNITILQSAANLGYTNNFMSMIKISTGDIICLCDQDDVWDSNKIKTIVDNMSFDAPKMIAHDVRICDSNMNVISPKYTSILNINYNLLRTLDYNCSQGSTICFNQLFKKELLSTLPTNTVYDSHINLVATALTCRQYIDQPLQSYRRHDSNATNIMHTNNTPVDIYSITNLLYSTMYVDQYICILNKMKNKLSKDALDVLELFMRISKNAQRLHNEVTIEQSRLTKQTTKMQEAIAFYNDFLDLLDK